MGYKEDKHGFIEGVHYAISKSSSSCFLSDITGILFGGVSSRFWMLRKHMNSIENPRYAQNDVPFFAWQCITIQTHYRDVDLVIHDEKDMDDLIMILVHAMNTIDGHKDTAKKAKDAVTDIK